METACIKTPIGIATVQGNDNGIVRISVADIGQVCDNVPEVLCEAVSQIKQYFDGTRSDFDFKVNPAGTGFQQLVWAELRKIAFGKSMSYQQLANVMGNPKAVRAVAAANGKNPLWIVVPCHRVIGSNGDLTGYAAGLWRKKWLLDHEQPGTQQLTMDLS